MSYSALPTPTDVHHTSTLIETYDGNDVGFHHFLNQKAIAATSPRPAVLYFHGGGMIAGSVGGFTPLIAYYASLSGISFFAVDYRLAPETRFPGPLHDAVSAYLRLTDDLQIPPENIIIAGDSAGGALSLALMMYLRDNDYPLPGGGILMSPWVGEYSPMYLDPIYAHMLSQTSQ